MNLKDYKNWCIANGHSEETIEGYLSKLRTFFNAVGDVDITEKVIVDYLVKEGETKTPNTVNGYKTAIASYARFKNLDIRMPKNAKRVKKFPEFVTLEYFENEIIPTSEKIFEKRLKVKALFYFMFYTGLRIKEIVLLKRENIDLTNRVAKIYLKKQNKEKYAVFPAKVSKMLERYFIVEDENKNAFNISVAGINHYFITLKPYCRSINMHPHLFRHSFASHLRKLGCSLEEIQDAMGHESRTSTEIYAHADYSNYKKWYDSKIK